MKHTIILFIILVFTFLTVEAMKPIRVITIDLSNATQKKIITVHKGDTVLIKLRMSSGTGYVWEIAGKLILCKQGDTKYEEIKKRMAGGPMIELISLNATDKGEEDISFIFHRPFEKDTAPSEIRKLHIIIQ